MKQVSSRRDSNRGAISSWLFIGMMLWIDVGSMLSSVLGLPLAVTSAGVLLLLAGLLVFYSQTPRSPDQAWSPRLLRGIKFLIAFYFVLNYVPLNRSGVAVSLAQREVLLGGGCALFWLAARERRTWPFVLCAALFGTLLRIVSYHTITLSTGGDMLPLVSAALQKFESGKSPYTTLYVPWPLPLTYPPLSFIPYLPFHYLGIDIRVTNLLAGLLLLGPILLIATAGQKRPALERISIILTEDFCRDASSARRDEGAGFGPVTKKQHSDALRLGKKPTEGLLRCALMHGSCVGHL